MLEPREIPSKSEIRNTKSEIRREAGKPDWIREISWVDEFVKKIKPYIHIRPEDNLLIFIPNQAYRLNRSGFEILNYVLNGGSVRQFVSLLDLSPTQVEEIHWFFSDLRAMVKGCLHESEHRRAVEYYEYKGPFNKLPVLSEIAVTYRCNNRCTFCYVGRPEGYGELLTADLKAIIKKIRIEANVPSVSFTGGEPLLRPDIVELVGYARKTGLWTNLITNGALLDRSLAVRLKQAGLSSGQVSLEGECAETHDALTGVAGSFACTIAGIRHLVDVGIPVHTNTTVSRGNIEHLEGIVKLVKRIGLSRLSMNLLIPCGAASSGPDLWVSYTEIGERILGLKQAAAEQNVKFLWYSPVPICIFNPIAHGLGNKACAAVSGLLSVDPLGNVLPCSSWPKPIGSLLTRPFAEIWNSLEAEYYRHSQYAPEQCRTCESFTACVGACPIYWDRVGQAELDTAAAAREA